MADCDRSSTSDNASVVSAEFEQKLLSSRESTIDPPAVTALETTNKETSELEFSEDEEILIAKMFNLVGERWSLIAGRIPGRSADEIEKYWKLRIYSKSQGESMSEILLKSKDQSQTIALKEESGHSTENVKGK
ncbi:Transcription factor TRY [Capsicum baccatum]|nr:MYB-like transcription factor ETC3 [Capsicum annuum]KAF3620287.1 Transcription factor TRY [Capsicum annuum]PHT43226.1 Transcription factor TRY [Capsicum baccatum]PHU12214.1 Transcription factor TRY [Capsicum chinense]